MIQKDGKTIPSYTTMLRPCLEFCNSVEKIDYPTLMGKLSKKFKISPKDADLIYSGKDTIFFHRTRSTVYYLRLNGWVTGYRIISITPSGKSRLKNPQKISSREYTKSDKPLVSDEELAPLERIQQEYDKYRKQMQEELLEKIKDKSSDFFEDLGVKLIRGMGYGIAGKVTPRSKDDGIDGIIFEDPLGHKKIYIQVKRWNNKPVTGPEVIQFVGTLDEAKSDFGIFITASRFVRGADKKGKKKNLALIDGLQLVKYMYDYDVGV